MNTPVFMPIKTFLKNVAFESPNSPGLFFNADGMANLEVSIDVQSRAAKGTSFYLVELHTRLTPKIDEQIVFNLNLIYSTLVEIANKEIEEECLKKVLQVDIPQSMYNPLRALVWNLTLESGFPPIMMSDYSFAEHQSNTAIMPLDYKKSDNTPDGINEEEIIVDEIIKENVYSLGYRWIIEDICMEEEGITFLETLKNATGNDLTEYHELPLYKYFYRFLVPIEYNHPEYDECDKSYWSILFQLLFGEGEAVKIIDKENSLPEIEFTYLDERRTISSLTFEELKLLTSDLAVQAFTQTCVDIIGMDIDKEVYDTLKYDRPILKEELLALFNCNRSNAKSENVEFVEKLYSRIKECDLYTFPYKL